MDRTLLDTDIFSEITKAKNSSVVQRSTAYRQQHGRYTISVVTVAEVVKGLKKRDQLVRIDKFLQTCDSQEVLLLDMRSAVVAGRILGELERQGQSIGRVDPFIAGIAIANDLTLATGNIRHFQRIVKLGFPLRLVNWRDETDS
jgi:tRNA(fMet)-specific endonuclease VapC